MNRRAIVVCLLSSTILLGRVHAQQTGKVYHVAVVSPNAQLSDMSEASHDQAMARFWGAFFGDLRQSGYVEGKNLVVERYSGEGRVERFRDLASGVVRRDPDLIYAVGPTYYSRSKQRPRQSQSLESRTIRLPLGLFPACPDRAAISRVLASMLDPTSGASVSNY
jgi:putative tryptophan/tyrosine transport system substrate-binding protein